MASVRIFKEDVTVRETKGVIRFEWAPMETGLWAEAVVEEREVRRVNSGDGVTTPNETEVFTAFEVLELVSGYNDFETGEEREASEVELQEVEEAIISFLAFDWVR